MQVGDTILEIDGKEVQEFNEINMAIVLADPFEPLDFKVERDGQIKHLSILPENNEDKNILMVGIGPALTREVRGTPLGSDPEREDVPRFGDQIVEVNGQEITDENASELALFMVRNPEKPLEVVVDRPEDPDVPDSPTKRLPVDVSLTLKIVPSDIADPNSINVLGPVAVDAV